MNEYSYESYFYNLSGKLIYIITKNKLLSFLSSKISYFIPSLRANTFGVGVRFRSENEWIKLFTDSGYRVTQMIRGPEKHVPFPRRILLLKNFRQNNYLLEPNN